MNQIDQRVETDEINEIDETSQIKQGRNVIDDPRNYNINGINLETGINLINRIN